MLFWFNLTTKVAGGHALSSRRKSPAPALSDNPDYDQFIEDNSTDQRRPFAASKSLLNMKKDLSLPHILFHFLQTIWVFFFIARITNVRSKLNEILAVNA